MGRRLQSSEGQVSTPDETQCGPLCRMYCPFGNVIENGCPICQCNEPPTCGPVCKIYCPHGNVLDEDGCPTCACNSARWLVPALSLMQSEDQSSPVQCGPLCRM